MAIQVKGSKRALLVAVFAVLIVLGGFFAVRSVAPRQAPPGQGPWHYVAYGQDVETGATVAFPVYRESLKWPLKNPKTGNDCLPLYLCNDCGAKFAGAAIGMTTSCPECGSSSVGAYSPAIEDEFRKRKSRPE